MEKPDNCVITIFGATGDLTKRKLMPSLFELFKKEALPRNFAILGLGRSDYDDESFREKMTINVKIFARSKPVNQKLLNDFLEHIFYLEMDPNNAEDYPKLNEKLTELSTATNSNRNVIYYLAVPPALNEVITANLGTSGLQHEGAGEGWKRIVFEKPFGADLASARALNRQIHQFFQEHQVYRIDQYLGKEPVNNILAFRHANGIFEPLWNRHYIHHVEITAAESAGVEDRSAYYDQAGALRDMVQNPLLHLMSLVAMELPETFAPEAIRNEKMKVYQAMLPLKLENIPTQVIRGQYTESSIRGEKIAAYRKEKNVDKESRTETFVAFRFFIDNWRWGGVPFYIRTGKRLPTRTTEVALHFKKTPHHLFTRDYPTRYNDNQLILRIHPDEGIMLRFGMRMPGTPFNIKSVNMDFLYKEIAEPELPDSYERLLYDALMNDATLFARDDAMEACWAFVDPILEAWRSNPEIKLYGYPAGTWGPKETSQVFENPNEDWRFICKNLVNDVEYPEL
jgi:glucose-6-phosphate 1-dehydrogenase